MKNVSIGLLIIFIFSGSGLRPTETDFFAWGQQPHISINTKGTLGIVFGRADSIFFAVSTDGGAHFSAPSFVAHLPNMHLGMSRGPQLATSARYSFITAMDKAGNIHGYQLTHATGKWIHKGLVNDVLSSAPEGLMGLAADEKDQFYAVWLDVRKDHKNNICFSKFTSGEKAWSKNKLVYISPDSHVCECCKPSIAVRGNKVAVMFRNWRQGARDLYSMTSANGGKTFDAAQKLGMGTWKLNACPMDGGAIAIDREGNLHTAWRRDEYVYYCQPGKEEQKLAKGRNVGLALPTSTVDNAIITFQNEGKVKQVNVTSKKEESVGDGNYLHALLLPDGKRLHVWEQDKKIMLRKE